MYRRYIKRPLDIVFALALIIALATVYLITAIVIKLESKGPVIFKQTRTGLNGKPFTLFKFRSMTAQNNVYDNTSADEVTRVGAFIRKTSIDELPQLINVIMGDMSFIGPRPWITAYYDHMNAEQRRRYQVRPGITGIAQVYGRNNLTIHQKINYDLRYVDHIGLREDLKVVFLTFVAVLSKEGEAMGKGGIHEELDMLRRQFEGQKSEGADVDNFNEGQDREMATQ